MAHPRVRRLPRRRRGRRRGPRRLAGRDPRIGPGPQRPWSAVCDLAWACRARHPRARPRRRGPRGVARNLLPFWLDDRPVHLGLVPAARSADIPAVTGMENPSSHLDHPEVSAILRSWEYRFGAWVVAWLGGLYVSVAAPPLLTQQAEQLALEHLLFCRDVLSSPPVWTFPAMPSGSSAPTCGGSTGCDETARAGQLHEERTTAIAHQVIGTIPWMEDRAVLDIIYVLRAGLQGGCWGDAICRRSPRVHPGAGPGTDRGRASGQRRHRWAAAQAAGYRWSARSRPWRVPSIPTGTPSSAT
jgi:Domain of unknown function (DUF4253)